MPVCVIDLFKVIYINQKKRNSFLVSFCSFQFSSKPFLKTFVVEQPRKTVCCCHLLHLLVYFGIGPMPKYTSRWSKWQQQTVLRGCSTTNVFRKGLLLNWKEQKDTRKEFLFFWLI